MQSNSNKCECIRDIGHFKYFTALIFPFLQSRIFCWAIEASSGCYSLASGSVAKFHSLPCTAGSDSYKGEG